MRTEVPLEREIGCLCLNKRAVTLLFDFAFAFERRLPPTVIADEVMREAIHGIFSCAANFRSYLLRD